ncbi:MAG TPA: aspartate/glutamate racemase family protein [Ramlibacter sp.]|nr:aspartate/glutamate racemase family protein [Ramlibacter sp.]
MKIWYQTFSASAAVEPRWTSYEEGCKRYIPGVARPGTQIHITGTDKRGPKMIFSKYVKYMHIGQVIENAVQAEREGYDAFVLGGMFDLGWDELREAVDIPVIGIAQASYYTACMLARQFAVIHSDEWFVKVTRELLHKYGISERCLPGAHLSGYNASFDLIEAFEKRPQEAIEKIKMAGRACIAQGAELLVVDFAPTTIFLCEQGIREIDGVPILDNTAALIKMTEMAVDLRQLGLPKPRMGPQFRIGKADVEAARRVYGFE